MFDLQLGTGRDGALVVDQANVVINTCMLLGTDGTMGSVFLDLTTAPSQLAAEDVVMVWNSRALETYTLGSGADIDVTGLSVGGYQVVGVLGVDGTRIHLSAPLITNFPAVTAQVVRIPQYTSVTVQAVASLVAMTWDGSCGGMVGFLANDVVLVHGSVDATSRGLGGGRHASAVAQTGCYALDEPFGRGAERGANLSVVMARGAGYGNAGNGGGGANCYCSGGGGGGGGGSGGKGGYTDNWDGVRNVGGRGGARVLSLDSRLVLGGGGGGGYGGNDGGAGGGVVWISALQLDVPDGRISASGASVAEVSNFGNGGGGGGGSVQLFALQPGTACNNVEAAGGNGGDVYHTWDDHPYGPGGGGGGGRVHLSGALVCQTRVQGGAAGALTVKSGPAAWGSANGTVGVVTGP